MWIINIWLKMCRQIGSFMSIHKHSIEMNKHPIVFVFLNCSPRPSARCLLIFIWYQWMAIPHRYSPKWCRKIRKSISLKRNFESMASRFWSWFNYKIDICVMPLLSFLHESVCDMMIILQALLVTVKDL